MREFFKSLAREEKLLEELRRWEGTPYVAQAAVCQGGGDCVRTADAILRACGWEGVVRWPRYAETGEDPRKLIDALDGIAELRRLEDGEGLQAGDLLVGISRTRGNPHLAIVESADFFWHMSSGLGRVGWCRRHRQVAERAWEVGGAWRPLENLGGSEK